MDGEVLIMTLRPEGIDVEIQSADDGNIQSRRELVFNTAKSQLKAFEEVVYDTPLLLDDYQGIRLEVDTPRFMTAPREITDGALQQQMMSVLWPAEDYEVMADPVTDADSLLWCIDTDILGFVRRTFMNAEICHRLSCRIAHCYGKNLQDNLSRMYVDVHGHSTDIIYIRDGRLAVANTYQTPTTADMMYYIMAAAQAATFSHEYDELVLSGDEAAVQQLRADLSQYVKNVK